MRGVRDKCDDFAFGLTGMIKGVMGRFIFFLFRDLLFFFFF
jgi:hypothetical protein